jgi:hypothetical protein
MKDEIALAMHISFFSSPLFPLPFLSLVFVLFWLSLGGGVFVLFILLLLQS